VPQSVERGLRSPFASTIEMITDIAGVYCSIQARESAPPYSVKQPIAAPRCREEE